MLLVSGIGFSIDGGGLYAIDGSAVEQLDRVSSGGLAYDGRRLARAIQCDANLRYMLEVVVYDERGALRYERIDESAATHDLAWDGDDLVVVATRFNAVRWFSPYGNVVREVRYPGHEDSWHLNCVTRHDGVWYATVFGAFNAFRRWRPPSREFTGRIIELETGRVVYEGLSAPHHPRWVDGEWLVCNSELDELLAVDAASGDVARRIPCGGWTRGLAFDDDFVYVGTSRRDVKTADVPRATVVVIDRRTWKPVERIPIKAQEIFAIERVPEAIVEGVRRGFETNPTRTSQRRQWQVLDELGCPEPRTLWPTGDRLAWDDMRATIEGRLPERWTAADFHDVSLRVTNRGRGFFTTAAPSPVYLSYKWLDPETGALLDERAAHRTWLTRTIFPGETADVTARVIATLKPGPARLRVALLQEGVAWFDEIDSQSALEAIVTVEAESTEIDEAPSLWDAARTRDGVLPAWASLTTGNYPLEQFRGESFYWIHADATIAVASDRAEFLAFAVEPGPGLGAQALVLRVTAENGDILTTVRAERRANVVVPLAGVSHPGSIHLTVAGGGIVIAEDPRVLNYRILSSHDENAADIPYARDASAASVSG